MSERADQINTWMQEAGPRLGAEEIRRCDDHLWVIAYDEMLLVEAELVIDRDLLVLGANLGIPLDSERTAVHETLLKANTLWRETGGLRFALEAETGEAHQTFDVGLAGLDFGGLCVRLENFANAARGWREVVASQAAMPPGQDDEEFPRQDQMLRI